MKKKSGSWFFMSGSLWPKDPKERKFSNGIITGSALVTFLTLLLFLIYQPTYPGEVRGVKRIGGEICEENACFALRLPEKPTEGCTSGPRTACVNITLQVLPSRRIIVDENKNILRIFSNTGLEYPDFKIFAAYQDIGGEEFPLTGKTKEQYQKLDPEINWAKTGLVYEYKPSLTNKAVSTVKIVWKKASDSIKELRIRKISANVN